MKILLTEQTTSGGIGVNMAAGAADPFKAEAERKAKLKKAFKRVMK